MDECPDPRALLVVSRSSSRCSACGKNALPERYHRRTGSSDLGCGAEFLGVTSLYAGSYFREATEELGNEVGLPYVHSVPGAGGDIVLVRNYDEAIRFYTGVLGLRVEEDLTIEPGGKRWVLLAAPKGYERLLLLQPGLASSSSIKMRVVYRTDDMSRTVAELKAKGVVFTRGPEPTDVGTEAELEDPDGNRVVLVYSTRMPT